MLGSARPVGDLLREWRQRRRLSQLDLALEADISTKHLSFVETGRALPSRDMVIHLADRLEIPLRERNRLLVAAGYAPVFRERPLGDPALDAVRRAVDQVLAGHEPYPALAVDRHWTLIAANAAVAPLLAGVAASLLEPPVNVLRLSLHPEGLAPRIANLAEWRGHLLARLDRQIDLTADPALSALRDELERYRPPPLSRRRPTELPAASPVVPLELVTQAGVLAFVSTVTVFGTPIDVTVSELAVEAFFPADAATAERLRRSGSS
ncbi:MAG TPA: helix-turn-helix transcriptional regulator [Stellaceae bacterium]|nr:helix-turn-helix transcriptional regulator [Stellaceae bacterium]